MYKKIAISFVFTFLISNILFAQKQNKKTPKLTHVKTTKSKFKSSIGNLSDSVVIEVSQAMQALEMPIVVEDDKKNKYTINTYQLLYKRRGIVQDEETGKTTPTTSLVAKQFKTTPLPDLWLKEIKEQLKAGEEIYFYDIVIKDASGKFFFAPDIKIQTK